jgi:uncharacterized protein (TIGR02284 family)
MDRNDTIGVLNTLIETCRDGQEGFQEAAENVVRSDIKQLFTEAAMQRARFLGELQAEVRALGGDPADAGSVAGALHRAWIDVKGTFSGRDEESILAEAERGEDSAVEAYRDALENELPANLRAIISAQYADVQRTHDVVKQYRNTYQKLPDIV